MQHPATCTATASCSHLCMHHADFMPTTPSPSPHHLQHSKLTVEPILCPPPHPTFSLGAGFSVADTPSRDPAVQDIFRVPAMAGAPSSCCTFLAWVAV